MAGLFGRGNSNFRYQSGGRRSSARTATKWKKKVVWKQQQQQKQKNPINYNKRFSLSKAGRKKQSKCLSLDPHRNRHHQHQRYQNQNPIPQILPSSSSSSSRHVEQEAVEVEESRQQPANIFSVQRNQQHQQSQQLLQQLYSRLDTDQAAAAEEPPPPPPPQQQPKKRSYFFPSSSSSTQNQESEHARLREKMGESFHHHQQLQQQQQQQSRQSSSSSRLGLRHSGVGGGEIVEVQGGHIVRSTGRKDRHSKVCTAKGPRDRRVRLSAHTAIQFYDVQDRLGYDRPSKAVDWLIKKAKSAIDELAELPAWTPTTAGSLANSNFEQEQTAAAQKQEAGNHQNPQQQHHISIHHGDAVGTISAGPSGKRAMTMLLSDGEQQLSMHHTGAHQSGNSSSFLPPSLDSDSIADTIKSFFPMGASTEANSSPMQFQSFPPPDLLSRTSSQSQDLRLSLQSFQDPMLLHHHHHHSQQARHHHTPTIHTEQAQAQAQAHAHALFSGHSQLGFDGSGWSEHQQPAEISRFHRLASYAGGDSSSSGGGGSAAGGGYLFSSQPAPPQPLLQQLFGQNQLFSQRGPLQSSNTPSVRAWMDPTSAITVATSDHIQTQNQHHHHHALLPIYPSGIGFASGGGGLPGFHIPARIQGEEEEHDGLSDKPSSASSDSRH